MRKKGKISEKLGLPMGPLTNKLIREKLTILEKGLKSDRYTGKWEKYARYYLSWYRYRLKNGKYYEKR